MEKCGSGLAFRTYIFWPSIHFKEKNVIVLQDCQTYAVVQSSSYLLAGVATWSLHMDFQEEEYILWNIQEEEEKEKEEEEIG